MQIFTRLIHRWLVQQEIEWCHNKWGQTSSERESFLIVITDSDGFRKQRWCYIADMVNTVSWTDVTFDFLVSLLAERSGSAGTLYSYLTAPSHEHYCSMLIGHHGTGCLHQKFFAGMAEVCTWGWHCRHLIKWYTEHHSQLVCIIFRDVWSSPILWLPSCHTLCGSSVVLFVA